MNDFTSYVVVPCFLALVMFCMGIYAGAEITKDKQRKVVREQCEKRSGVFLSGRCFINLEELK